MKGTNLGEFEELVLLTIAALMEEAYSVAVCDELTKHTGRDVKLAWCTPCSTGWRKRAM
mgnify:CR=1 FL=1